MAGAHFIHYTETTSEFCMTLHGTLDHPPVAHVGETTFHDLMAGIGYLLFQWSLLDRSLDTEIAVLRQAAGDVAGVVGRARTVNERLAEWRALLARGRRNRIDHQAIEQLGERIQDCFRRRNLVATGFVTASDDRDMPTMRCAHGTSRHGPTDEVRLGTADILDWIDDMELCRSEMTLLRDLAVQ